MKTLRRSYTASDIAAFHLVHKLWTFLSRRNDCDPNYFDTRIDVQNGGWRKYRILTGLSAINIDLEIEFTLIRHESSGALQGCHYWGLDDGGLELRLRIGSRRANLIFRTLESGTLYPDTESAIAVAGAQRLWEEATA